jgi:hypothetical protein
MISAASTEEQMPTNSRWQRFGRSTTYHLLLLLRSAFVLGLLVSGVRVKAVSRYQPGPRQVGASILLDRFPFSIVADLPVESCDDIFNL